MVTRREVSDSFVEAVIDEATKLKKDFTNKETIGIMNDLIRKVVREF